MRGIGRWLKVNGEAIYGSRRWKIIGEGPAVMLKYNNVKKRMDWNYRQEFSAKDIRFTRKGDNLYAIALNWPQDGKIIITTLKEGSEFYPGKINSLTMLGTKGPVKWKRTATGLEISMPKERPCDYACTFRIN
jgi:alpha-L-fucosidase